MAKLWIDRQTVRIYAILEVRSDGKCGIVMTSESKHLLKIALSRMIMARKKPRTNLFVSEFRED